MNALEDLRINNIVDYAGNHRNDRYVRISEITKMGDGRTLYTLVKSYGEDTSFAGYTEEIRPIYLEHSHLQTLGLNRDKTTKIYNLNGVGISRMGYAEGPPSAATFVDLGFKIIPPGFPATHTLEQVKELPITLLYIHDLQNYCTDNKIDGVDFSSLR